MKQVVAVSSTDVEECLGSRAGGRTATGKEQHPMQGKEAMLCGPTYLLLTCFLDFNVEGSAPMLKHLFVGLNGPAIPFLSTGQTGMGSSHSGRVPPIP